MAAFTFGVEIKDFGGGLAGGISDLLRDQGMAIRTTFKQPELPKNMTTEADRLAYVTEVDNLGRARRAAEEALREAERFYNQAMSETLPAWVSKLLSRQVSGIDRSQSQTPGSEAPLRQRQVRPLHEQED